MGMCWGPFHYQESSLPHVLTGEVGQGSFSMTTRSKTKKRLNEEELRRKSPPISPLNQRSLPCEKSNLGKVYVFLFLTCIVENGDVCFVLMICCHHISLNKSWSHFTVVHLNKNTINTLLIIFINYIVNQWSVLR